MSPRAATLLTHTALRRLLRRHAAMLMLFFAPPICLRAAAYDAFL